MANARLLYLGNGTKPQSVAMLDDRFEGWGLTVDRYWAYSGEFPKNLDSYEGIFLSGSPHGAYEDIPFIHREHSLIQDAAAQGIPMLGICFGSQILASALCGRDQVFRRHDCEIGYKDLLVTDAARDDTIAGGLLHHVHMFVWHNDEVRGDHPDMTILARSDICPIIPALSRYTCVGIQGHPEIIAAQAPVWFNQNRKRMQKDGADVDVLIASADEAAEAKTMLTRFADVVKTRS